MYRVKHKGVAVVKSPRKKDDEKTRRKKIEKRKSEKRKKRASYLQKWAPQKRAAK